MGVRMGVRARVRARVRVRALSRSSPALLAALFASCTSSLARAGTEDVMLLAARRLGLPSRPALGACHLRAGRALSSIKLPDNFFDEISEGARPQEKVRPLFLACCSSSSLSACDFFRARRAASTSARRLRVGESCSNSLERRIRHVSVEREPLGGSRGEKNPALRVPGPPSSNSRRHKKERMHAAAVRVRCGTCVLARVPSDDVYSSVCVYTAYQGNIETPADGQARDRDGASQRAGRSASRLGPPDSPSRLKRHADCSALNRHSFEARTTARRRKGDSRGNGGTVRCFKGPSISHGRFAEPPRIRHWRVRRSAARRTQVARCLSPSAGPHHRRRAKRESTYGAAKELSPMHAPPRTLASAIGRTPAAREEQRTGHERTSTLRCEG